jgi:hypothetical protein
MNHYKKITCLFIVLTFSGCSSLNGLLNKSNAEVGPFFYKDGREVSMTKCDGQSWSGCYAKAGQECKENGYNILEKNTSREKSFFRNNQETNELYYICKK